MSWIENITRSRELVKNESQTALAAIVSGSAADAEFWASEVETVKRDVIREDGRVDVHCLAEESPAGNFLGTIRAWTELKRRLESMPSRGVAIMSMVFGQGKRLSPFTQALGNRKAAFPTPLRGGHSGTYLRTGDIALLDSSLLTNYLSASGFNGILVKWGDEATIPGLVWRVSPRFTDVDVVRFVWRTRPTEVYAREKEWLILNDQTGLIERMIPRRPYESLAEILGNYQTDSYGTAVNLGSVAVSYKFLEIASEVLGDLAGSKGFAADWDPIVNLLLLLKDDEDPADDAPTGAGIRAAETRCPGLEQKMGELRVAVKRRLGRPPRVGFLEYGDALWIDLGLHTTLRKTLEATLSEDSYGRAVRAFFGLPDQRDANGNIIVSSAVSPRARIGNSLIVDSTVSGDSSVVQNGVVVGSRHQDLIMPEGGASLFCAAQRAAFQGPRGIAFRAVRPAFELAEGGRYTTFFARDHPIPLVSNEAIQRYDESEYSSPILGNTISFEQAALESAAVDPWQLEARWREAWNALSI